MKPSGGVARYSRGRQSPLRSLVRCDCGHRMTPKASTSHDGSTHHYYECTRTIHQGESLQCCAPRIPATALESAVLRCLRRLSTSQQAPQRIVEEAHRHLGKEAQKAGEGAALIRQRLGTVQAEINNLRRCPQGDWGSSFRHRKGRATETGSRTAGASRPSA